jgi:threonine/homoserine/homoserine lactone efflux protein
VSAALLGFAFASTLLIVAPGPDTMLVMRNTMRGGRAAGWVTACGTMSGLAIWAVAAALGLSALLRVSHVGYDALRIAGGGYLIWLGVTSLGLVRRRAPGHATATGPAEPAPGMATRVRAYLTGVLSNLLNPKIGVFFIAFLPAFIPAGVSTARFSLVLGLWFMVETGLWLGIVAWLADRGARWLRRPAAQRWLGRFTGVVLIGFGIRLVTSSR